VSRRCASVCGFGFSRRLKTEGFTPYPEQAGQEKLAVPDIDFIMIGEEKIDTRSIANILCRERRTSIGFMIRLTENRRNGVFVNPENEVERIFREIAADGLDTIYSGFFPERERFLAMPRVCDLHAVVNRMRRLTYEKMKS